jgi:hypothetical protein
VKFSSVISIQIFSLKNANPSINEIYVENNYFPLPSKFEMIVEDFFQSGHIGDHYRCKVSYLVKKMYAMSCDQGRCSYLLREVEGLGIEGLQVEGLGGREGAGWAGQV